MKKKYESIKSNFKLKGLIKQSMQTYFETKAKFYKYSLISLQVVNDMLDDDHIQHPFVHFTISFSNDSAKTVMHGKMS